MTDEARIRELAYQIWLVEGQPQGQHERHWEMARKLVETESPPAKTPPATTAGRPIPTVAKTVLTRGGATPHLAHKRRRAAETETRPAG